MNSCQKCLFSQTPAMCNIPRILHLKKPFASLVSSVRVIRVISCTKSPKLPAPTAAITFLCRHFRLPTAATVARATKRCRVLGHAEVPQEEAPGATAIPLVLQRDTIHHTIPHKTPHVESNTSSARTHTSMYPLAKTIGCCPCDPFQADERPKSSQRTITALNDGTMVKSSGKGRSSGDLGNVQPFPTT